MVFEFQTDKLIKKKSILNDFIFVSAYIVTELNLWFCQTFPKDNKISFKLHLWLI